MAQKVTVKVRVANGEENSAYGTGNIEIKIFVNGNWIADIVYDVLFVLE